jgi:hypothetical protein
LSCGLWYGLSVACIARERHAQQPTLLATSDKLTPIKMVLILCCESVPTAHASDGTSPSLVCVVTKRASDVVHSPLCCHQACLWCGSLSTVLRCTPQRSSGDHNSAKVTYACNRQTNKYACSRRCASAVHCLHCLRGCAMLYIA